MLYDSDDNVQATWYDADDDGSDVPSEDDKEQLVEQERQWLAGVVEDTFASHRLVEAFEQQQRAARREGYERLLRHVSHCECCYGDNIRVCEERVVTVLCAGAFMLPVTVPIYSCAGRPGRPCGHRWHRQAAAIGCFPSGLGQALKLHLRPRSTVDLIWFEVKLLQLIIILQHRSPQFAVKACSESLASMTQGMLSASRVERLLGPTLDRFRAYDFEMLRNATLGCHDYPLEQGILGICSARCHLAGKPDEHGNPIPLGDLQLDACMGLRRRADAAPKANALRTEPLVVDRCLPVHEADGRRLFPGVAGIRRGAAEWCEEIHRTKEAAGDEGPVSSCSTFKAATDVSGKQRLHDQTGVFAMFCTHGFALGSAIMHAGEKYSYAVMMLHLLLAVHNCGVERIWCVRYAYAPAPVHVCGFRMCGGCQDKQCLSACFLLAVAGMT